MMRAVTWHSPRTVTVEDVPDAAVVDPGDALVRVTSTAICGSDLHLYDVFGPFMRRGDVLGHEAMGVVEAVGSSVGRVEVGDRVVVPFVIACGECAMCAAGLPTQCETTQNREQGTGAALYGYTELYGAVAGGQAEYLRVRLADANAVVVGRDLPDERYLYLSDVLPTAWQAVRYAGVSRGDTLAVLGLGPVGQLVTRIARREGVAVIAIEPVVERRLMAERYGAVTLDLDDVDAVVDAVRAWTDARGVDAVVDAVGLEADGNAATALVQNTVGALPTRVAKTMMRRAGVDRLAALDLAIELVRRGGTVSIVGVYAGMLDPIPMMQVFDKQLTIRAGQANVQRWIPELLPIAEADGDPLGLEDLATHRAPLERAPEMYEQFKHKSAGCIKVVLRP